MDNNNVLLAEDSHESVNLLLRLRIPSLLVGFILAIALSFLTSNFEEVFAKNVAVVFFIPFIVYLAAAVGAQTQSIYIRNLRIAGKGNFKVYLIKESILGFILGSFFALITAILVLFWFDSQLLMLAVSISTFGAIASAPVIALIVTQLLQVEHTDPAVGAGPLATVVQDSLSILIYGLIASAILL